MDTARALLTEALSTLRPGYGLRNRYPGLAERIDEYLAAPGLTPVVVVVRDPDYENTYAIFDGDVEIHDIDLGNSDLTERDEWLGWAASHLHFAISIESTRPEAADHIRDVVWSSVENIEWGGKPDEFQLLDDRELIALAEREGLL